jgi:hypothetical protein
MSYTDFFEPLVTVSASWLSWYTSKIYGAEFSHTSSFTFFTLLYSQNNQMYNFAQYKMNQWMLKKMEDIGLTSIVFPDYWLLL